MTVRTGTSIAFAICFKLSVVCYVAQSRQPDVFSWMDALLGVTGALLSLAALYFAMLYTIASFRRFYERR